MARYPGATWKPLPQNASQDNQNSDIQVIFHSLTSSDIDSSWQYFATGNSAGTDCTFLVAYDGRIIQALDTDARADANWAANSHAVSIETASNGGATDPWTPAQLAALTKLGRWLLTVHPGIGRRKCRAWDDPGFGYHRMFTEWNQSGHTCPGNARAAQFPGLLQGILAPTQEDDVTPADIEAIVTAIRQSPIHASGGDVTLVQWIADIGRNVEDLQRKVDALTPKA